MEKKVEPEGCKECERRQCQLHCPHFQTRLEMRGLSPTSPRPTEKVQDTVAMQGTY